MKIILPKEETMVTQKKLIALLGLFILVMSIAGCFTIKVGGKAQLASRYEAGTLVAQKRCWYALYGLIPLGDNSTDSIIPETAKKVRVETKYKLTDALINLFTGLVSIETFSVEIYEVN